ncbi:MAG: hypothetical protein GY851_24300 [bacterium]|nr:hypothetical protein [bacterium]
MTPFETVIDSVAPFGADFTIPDHLVGSLTVLVMARDDAALLEAEAVEVSVVPAGSPENISVTPSGPLTIPLYDTLALTVLADIAPSVTADITSSAAGTVYQSYDGAVATVSPEGEIAGVALGLADVLVTNGEVIAVPVEVVDVDHDGDGLWSGDEGEDDIDGDGIPNYFDLDSDGDGLDDDVDPDPFVRADGLPLNGWLTLAVALGGLAAAYVWLRGRTALRRQC